MPRKTKTVSTTGSKYTLGGQTKTLHKGGKKKAELKTNYSGMREVPMGGGNPRFLSRTMGTTTEKAPASMSLNIYNRKGDLKKTLVASNRAGTGMNPRAAKKINRKFRRMSK